MDVGTGRQAIAFHELGAKSVWHFDLSPENVEKMSLFIQRKGISDTVHTKQCDLVEYELPNEFFDFVYLSGVVQHFSYVSKGLLNCCGSVKVGGYLWLYFFRSGTFHVFVMSIIRDLVKLHSHPHDFFVSSCILHSEDARPSFHTSNVMDGFFVEHWHLYEPGSYLKFTEQAGFEVTSSSRLDPVGRRVDHEFASPAVVVTLRKVGRTDPEAVDLDLLEPDRSVDQLDRDIYNEDIVLRTIDLYEAVRKKLLDSDSPQTIIMAIAFRLFDFTCNVDEKWTAVERHERMQKLLANIDELL